MPGPELTMPGRGRSGLTGIGLAEVAEGEIEAAARGAGGG